MNMEEFYPELICTKEVHDDFVIIRLKFNNGEDGAMCARVDTIGDDATASSYSYPRGDITIWFEGGGPGYVADTGTLDKFGRALLLFVKRVSVSSTLGD